MILNDYPMLRVRTSLRAGDKPGTADLLAAASDSRYIAGGISYDDFGSSSISKHRTSLWFDMGGLVADGDLLMLRGSTGLDRIDLNKLSYGRAEYLIPVDHNGTKLGLYGANSLYKVGETLAPLQIEGTATIMGFYLTHPLIKKRDQTLSVRAGFDYKNVTDYMLDTLNSKDNIRALSLGVSYDFYDGLEGRNVIGLTYHQGLSGFLGGAARNEVGTSRADADGGFNKYTMDYVRLQGITEFTHILLKAAGQVSGTTLFSAEQFSIGGMGTVRGFKSSAHSGDSGYIFSAELHTWPIFPEAKIFGQRLGDTIKFVPFADCGRVYKDNVQPGENKNNYIQSVGAGLRLYAGRKFSMRLDYAVPKVNGIFHKRNSMTYAQASMAF
ncbi:MAG: ShlB/FhaC/HecB family hemolysin secretion/activation protein [Nitrospirae bacterium]|nr:MAG: ShlB/FhaC/HecB family hemolysin secretion/activation protein [Nitrospirota bacterium]